MFDWSKWSINNNIIHGQAQAAYICESKVTVPRQILLRGELSCTTTAAAAATTTATATTATAAAATTTTTTITTTTAAAAAAAAAVQKSRFKKERISWKLYCAYRVGLKLFSRYTDSGFRDTERFARFHVFLRLKRSYGILHVHMNSPTQRVENEQIVDLRTSVSEIQANVG